MSQSSPSFAFVIQCLNAQSVELKFNWIGVAMPGCLPSEEPDRRRCRSVILKVIGGGKLAGIIMSRGGRSAVRVFGSYLNIGFDPYPAVCLCNRISTCIHQASLK